MLKYLMPVVVIIAVIAVFIAATHDQGSSPIEPGPSPEAKGGGFEQAFIEDMGAPHDTVEGLSASACQGCHRYIYDDWAGSPHAAAMTHEPFTASLAHVVRQDGIEAARSCFACHAPHAVELEGLSSNGELDTRSVSMEGINCFACHSRELPVGAHILQPDHEYTKIDPSEPEFCASCHNPDEALIAILDANLASQYGIQAPLGNPYAEWQESDFSRDGENYRSCLSCHGQSGTGTLHSWPEDKAEMIRSAYTIEADESVSEMDNLLGAKIVITNSGAGHKLPTADPGSRLAIETRLINRDTQEIVKENVFYLGFWLVEGGNLVDNRIGPGESATFTTFFRGTSYDLPENPNIGLQYRITYEIDPVMAIYLGGLGVTPQPIIIKDWE